MELGRPAHRRLMTFVTLLTLAGFVPAVALGQANGRRSTNVVDLDIPATLGGAEGRFVGTLTTEVAAVAGELVAAGTIAGTFTDAAGNATAIAPQAFAALVDVAPAVGAQQAHTCPILDLDIGAIHLDLLGLVIDLAPIHLDIVAEGGPGNLLGNLLCAVAGLLDGTGGNLGAIANLLNRILGLLGSIVQP